jgi:excisionase family DNA binding protein
MENLISIRKAAEILDIDVSTIYRYIHEGKIPVYKMGNLVKFRESELSAWVDERLNKPTAKYIRRSPQKRPHSRKAGAKSSSSSSFADKVVRNTKAEILGATLQK